MIVKVFPKIVVEKTIEKSLNLFSKWALISINDSNQKLIDLDKEQKLKQINCEKILSLDFSDLTEKQYEEVKNSEQQKFKEEFKLFSDEQSRFIINFVSQIKSDKSYKALVVHCSAGISRSGAVGLWASRFLNLKENDFWFHNPTVYPNSYILDKLLKMSGMKNNYEDFWNNIEISNDFFN